ncbi:MAG TPA: hypothetical protein VGT43_12545 [Burkholderiales bacterium]|nr:hypothetical protein [Burkholderiales bacterium]
MLGLAGLAAVSMCMAGSTGGVFGVNISMNYAGGSGSSSGGNSAEVCISQALSEQNNAIVRVVCESGQFVSISAIPGGRFVGSHGGAYTFYFGSSYRSVNVSGYGEFAHGAGSVAGFRVFGMTESEGRLDMLIEF